IAEVLQLYARNRLRFMEFVFPAVLIATCTYLFRRHEMLEIQRHIPRGIELLQHKAETFEMGALTWGRFLFNWLCFCFLFAGICVATEQLIAGSAGSKDEVFGVMMPRIGSLLRLSLLLFVVLVLVVGVLEAILGFVLFGILRPHHLNFGSYTLQL